MDESTDRLMADSAAAGRPPWTPLFTPLDQITSCKFISWTSRCCLLSQELHKAGAFQTEMNELLSLRAFIDERAQCCGSLETKCSMMRNQLPGLLQVPRGRQQSRLSTSCSIGGRFAELVARLPRGLEELGAVSITSGTRSRN